MPIITKKAGKINGTEEKRLKIDEKLTIKDRKAAIMAESVREAIRSFCGQNREFAEAVEQGGSFDECMTAICKGVGGSISDIEAYRRAAAFFFKGAEVRFEMRIELPGDEEDKGMILDLRDFL